MKNILKQLEEWATLSNLSEFKKATILLTTYYTVGVFIILVIFNILVYSLFTNSIYSTNENIKEQSSEKNEKKDNKLEENKIHEIQENLAGILITSDIAILIFTLMIAYVLSKHTLKPIEEAYKKQSMFVANAAHELRTPLSVIKAGSEVILRNDRTQEEYKKYTKESLEEIERLITLSNDLLFLAQNNKKGVNLNSKLNFSEICKKQINAIEAYALIHKITIKDEVENNLNTLGNKSDLTRLVINLLKNAIDYNKKEGSVTISLKKKNNKIILSVIDTGIGIKKENLINIYDRFYKVDDSRTQNSSSAGLGLAIVKNIVEEHHGSIKANSSYGNGTTFEVILKCV
ncbi:hypothetical protein COX93_01265 [Candidatus Nomurabacteria bacterium CG_4_10_14_0_2_um_filter_30_12]|uniref:histidine kinase n=2 Tax=Candidatus Nomuraibacteriota TaxID=1752729 RepID=A0A2J0MG05_9BACT|nr:MAG: hypothetical protein COU48_02710 [Candidatus Nomurabacteria bacterium CG10_big_fil_rev_8_21_14_0_10_03_31_7]PIZ87339.1 MAG: hypothetical protein COX93_01265 [Candidatus Nomurabacteria bacterium CG_4_10_14_0_2_um_filter_30_12]